MISTITFLEEKSCNVGIKGFLIQLFLNDFFSLYIEEIFLRTD